MKARKLIYCVPRKKGKNGPNHLSLYFLTPDSRILGSRYAFLWMGGIIVTVVCVFGLSYILQVTNFPVLGRAKDKVEFLAITLYLWSAMPATPGLGFVWGPCCPCLWEQNLFFLSPSFLKRLFFHDFVLLRLRHKRRGFNYFLLFRGRQGS